MEFTLFCNSRIWVTNWLTVVGFLPWCIDNSSILACLTRSFSSQQILLNSSAVSCMIFLGEPTSQFQFSFEADFVSLWAWSANRLDWCSWNHWDSNSWLISWKSDVRISLLSISRLHFSLSFIQSLLSHYLSSDGRVNLPFKDFLEILSHLQCLHNVLISISLPFRTVSIGRHCSISVTRQSAGPLALFFIIFSRARRTLSTVICEYRPREAAQAVTTTSLVTNPLDLHLTSPVCHQSIFHNGLWFYCPLVSLFPGAAIDPEFRDHWPLNHSTSWQCRCARVELPASFTGALL